MDKKEKNEIKNMLCAWGSSGYILSLERSEFEKMKKMCRNMSEIKALYNEGNGEKTSAETVFEKNMLVCKGRLERLNKMMKSYIESKVMLDDIIDGLSYVEQHILRARYEKKLPWELIPFNLPFDLSKRHCQRQHDLALDKIYEELKNRGKMK